MVLMLGMSNKYLTTSTITCKIPPDHLAVLCPPSTSFTTQALYTMPDLLADPALTIFGFSVLLPLAFSLLAKPYSPSPRSHYQLSHQSSRGSKKNRRIHFPLECLPNEIILILLSAAVASDAKGSAGTYRTLLLTSRRLHLLASRICLPFVEVHLRTSDALKSFHRFVLSDCDRALSVRHLRIDPFIPLSAYEQDQVCASIVQHCRNVHYLECHGRVLKRSILTTQPFVHKRCRRLLVWTRGECMSAYSMEQFEEQGTLVAFR